MRFAILFGAVLALAADDKGPTVTFGKDDLGKLPAGWKAEKTGKGDASVWKVVADDTAPSKKGFALAQTAKADRPTFNLCVRDEGSYKDVKLGVAFKAVKGEVDQGGGLLWRYQDPDNYYVARYNPLEGNFRFYKVVAGKRSQLATKEEIELKAGEWHTLDIAVEADKVECRLNGKVVVTATDNAIDKAGKVGLWTKADAQTYFDDFRVRGK